MRLLFVLFFLTTNSFGQSVVLCKDVQGLEVDDGYVLGSEGWNYTNDPERLKNYTGDVKVCYEGTLYCKIKYVNGLPNGPYSRISPNGLIREKGNYLNGIKEGPWAYYNYGEFYDGHFSVEKGEYKKGYKVGEWINSSDNGQLNSKKNYVVDTLYGLNYLDSLKKELQQEFSDDGIKNNYSQDEINEIIQKNQVIGFEILHGQWIYYHSNGQVHEKRNFLNGVQDGEWIEYYENGQTQIKGNYVNGQPEGEWTYYYENGQTQIKGTYVNGQPEGEWICYYENGEIKFQGDFNSSCFFNDNEGGG
jgi:antitoxin component YwqK of YwqJK toxin-antitoxin module